MAGNQPNLSKKLSVLQFGFIGNKPPEQVNGLPDLPLHHNICFVKKHALLSLSPLPDIQFTDKNECNLLVTNVIENWEREGNCPNVEWCKIVMLQLAHACQHLHENEEVPIIEKDTVHLSQDKKQIILEHAQREQRKEDNKGKRRKLDLQSLGKFFYYLLSGKDFPEDIQENQITSVTLKYIVETDKPTAINLINGMIDGINEDYSEITRHPLFWSTQNKLRFICDTSDVLANINNKNDTRSALNKYSKGTGWLNELSLTEIEISEAVGWGKKYGKKVKPAVDEIKKMNLQSKDDTCGLIRAIRNRSAHFHDDSVRVKATFNGDKIAGIWKFFAQRFPDLLITTWETMKNKQPAGYKEAYYQTSTQPVALPNIGI